MRVIIVTAYDAVAYFIVFRLVRDVVANHKTTRYAGATTKVIQKITLLKYNVGVQAALYLSKVISKYYIVYAFY
jgi:hypothetical protein